MNALETSCMQPVTSSLYAVSLCCQAWQKRVITVLTIVTFTIDVIVIIVIKD